LDHTLCGSRSGANVIATWMILNVHGSHGILKRMNELIEKTNFLCDSLTQLGIRFFRNKYMNIVTIRSDDISKEISEKYTLVPEKHEQNQVWWKIVVMEHVTMDLIQRFLKDISIYSTKHSEMNSISI